MAYHYLFLKILKTCLNNDKLNWYLLNRHYLLWALLSRKTIFLPLKLQYSSFSDLFTVSEKNKCQTLKDGSVGQDKELQGLSRALRTWLNRQKNCLLQVKFHYWPGPAYSTKKHEEGRPHSEQKAERKKTFNIKNNEK